MRAAAWYGRRDVRIEDVPEPPPPPPGQVQVEVAWCGICGTDLHEYMGGPLYIPERSPHPLTGVQAPVIIGHEMSGRVTAVGDGVADLAVGDRVAGCPIIGCGKCRWCRSGSMAQCEKVAFLGTSWTGGALSERLNLNAYQCYRLPDSISDEVGALVEPFSSTCRALVKGMVGPEDNVAIVGGGPIGLMNLMAAKVLGAKRVVVLEIEDRRIETALQCGATAVINPLVEDPHRRAAELTDGAGFDVVAECAGRESTGLLAGRLVRTRGRVIVMGVFEKPSPLDFTDLVFREKTIIGSMSGYGLYNETIAMMNDERFRGEMLITRRIPLEHLIDEGYRSLLGENGGQVKILVAPRDL